MITSVLPKTDPMLAAGSGDSKDALFAVSLLARERRKFKADFETGEKVEITGRRVKHRLFIIEHAGPTSAQSSACECFEQLYPDFEIWSALVEPVAAP